MTKGRLRGTVERSRDVIPLSSARYRRITETQAIRADALFVESYE